MSLIRGLAMLIKNGGEIIIKNLKLELCQFVTIGGTNYSSMLVRIVLLNNRTLSTAINLDVIYVCHRHKGALSQCRKEFLTYGAFVLLNVCFHFIAIWSYLSLYLSCVFMNQHFICYCELSLDTTQYFGIIEIA